MSKGYDKALQIWDMQNSILFDYGVDIVNRVFTISSEIDEYSFHELDLKLALLERNENQEGGLDPITIRLNSPGGSTYDAWAMVSRIKSSPCKITIEAHGHIMSAATMLLAAGSTRKVSKYCTFMFHESSYTLGGKHTDNRNMVISIEKEEQTYYDFLEQCSKKSSKYWKKLIKSKPDAYMNAEEVLKTGLIDEIF